MAECELEKIVKENFIGEWDNIDSMLLGHRTGLTETDFLYLVLLLSENKLITKENLHKLLNQTSFSSLMKTCNKSCADCRYK